MKEKIGVGITTCNRPDFLYDCINSLDLDKLDKVVIVNDGAPFDFNNTYKNVDYIQNEQNLGVAKSRNKLFKALLKSGCDHIFMLEDDCIILDNIVFQKYIDAYKTTGIPHFNFGPGSPWNRYQDDPTIIGNLSLRHLARQDTLPNPKLIIDHKNGIKLAFYEHIVAMFCYFHRSIIEEVGLFDERFYNAWEHVDHTYRIIKAGKYSPFWWFADIYGSEKYIQEAKNEKARSSLAKNEQQYNKQLIEGIKIFRELHGTIPGFIAPATKEQVVSVIKKIYEAKSDNIIV